MPGPLPKPVALGMRRQLRRSEEGRRELSRLEAKRRRELDKIYPKPTLADIEAVDASLASRFSTYHDGAMNTTGTASNPRVAMQRGYDGLRGIRDVRYHRDELSPKWREQLQGSTRIHSNLSNNEVTNVRGLLGRNPIKITVPPAGATERAIARAKKESRWLTAFTRALERQSGWPLIQIIDDALAEGSLVAVEWYLTGAYDDVNFNPADMDDYDGKGNGITRPERDREYNARIEGELMEAGLPFAMRHIDTLAVRADWDQYGAYVATIAERKPYRHVYSAMRARLSGKEWEAAALPDPHSAGTAQDYELDGDGGVLTMRYYDRRWYAYVVGGKIIEGPKEHGFPDLPVRFGFGFMTSSPIAGERFQGVTWGMTGLERALHDRLTLDFDSELTYSKPLPLIETDVGGSVLRDAQGQPRVLNLRDGIVQLNPGQHLVDATAQFKIQRTEGMDILMSLFQRSGMNPVAQGESPGADPSGYALNSLQSGALQRYQPLLNGKAAFWEDNADFARRTIRDTVQEDVYLAVPMEDQKQGGIEWQKLGPDDITESPSRAVIDPLTDLNRMALAEWLAKGVERGVVPEDILMTRGYGSEDYEEWYGRIDLDTLRRELRGLAVQEVLASIQAGNEARTEAVKTLLDGLEDPSAIVPPPPPQLPPGGAPGMVPQGAPPQAATVGPAGAAISQGGTMPGVTQRLRAGTRPTQQGVTAAEANAQ